ncbi:response regulator [Thalassobellus suaedae]|uniref:Response regulator n=1 Tax=Thalassobellus suaedae TaxID=3074124 RepID=A0ABY9Y2M5_9FLAO|nr:response regulator [Flavobacteriaceae bacterium HL-DH10]
MKNVHILLVEDNEGDILLTTEALEEVKLANTVSIARDGEAAIKFLNKEAPYQNEEEPDLILLDINLPKVNGQEVLKHIKSSEHLKHIPVIVLTTSSSYEDVTSSYRSYANCYIVKPVEIDDFIKAIGQIENFWISIVKLPSK